MNLTVLIPDRVRVIDESGRELGHADLVGSAAQLAITDPSWAAVLRVLKPPVSLGFSLRIEAAPAKPANRVPVMGAGGEVLGYRAATAEGG